MGSDNFTLDSSLNSPTDRPQFMQHQYQHQQYALKSPQSYQSEQLNPVPPKLDYLVHAQKENENKPDAKLPKAPVKKLKYPPKNTQIFVSEVEDQQTERFDFSGANQSKIAEMIESQVTCVEYQAARQQTRLESSEIEAEKIQSPI